jgi:hypothetical protein
MWDFWDPGFPDFYALDLNGNVVYKSDVFEESFAKTFNNAWGDTNYHRFDIGPDGTLYMAWTNLYAGTPYPYFQDEHFMMSPDGGKNWVAKNGPVTLPVRGDDAGPTWKITNSADLGSGTSTSNFLGGLLYNGGKLHFVYGGCCTSNHSVYERFDLSTKSFDGRNGPNYRGETISFYREGSLSGSATGRIFHVGPIISNGVYKVGAIYSDDIGSSWHDFALSDNFQANNDLAAFISAARRPMADGSVIGSGTVSNGSGGCPIYFFRSVPK